MKNDHISPLNLTVPSDELKNTSKENCKFCHQKPVFCGDFFSKRDSGTLIAENGWTEVFIGADIVGRIAIYAEGDDRTDDYYPKYCPECGRKLIESEAAGDMSKAKPHVIAGTKEMDEDFLNGNAIVKGVCKACEFDVNIEASAIRGGENEPIKIEV